MEEKNFSELERVVAEKKIIIDRLIAEVSKAVIGQEYIIRRVLTVMLSGGHILLEGLPGLAKTLIIKTFSDCMNLKFQRIQFTPDLLPSDLTGTQMYDSKESIFKFSKGPIFSNIILADEINRAPAKVQSALLEAMQEKQVTAGRETYSLELPFFTLATQNPIEQEGTYHLPEAQMDRFMMKILMKYPSKNEEIEILRKYGSYEKPEVNHILDSSEVLELQKLVYSIYTDSKIEEYIISIIDATRNPEKYGAPDLKNKIEFGASPRATLSLGICAKANALISGRHFVTPDDIKIIAADILRHRIILTFEAEAENINADNVIRNILEIIEVP